MLVIEIEEDTNTVVGKQKYFAKYFREERLTTLNQSAGTLRPLRLSGIAAPERENPGRDLHVFTLSPTLLVDLLHSWKPDIPTVTMLPPQPESFGHVRSDTGWDGLLAARTWDLVVVLVVGQTAGHQEGGWSTGYLFVLQVFI